MAETQALNAIDFLSQQHREVEELFAEFERTEDTEACLQIASTICDKLAIHARIEELYFYPAAKAGQTEDMVLEALEEHVQVKRCIADLLALDPEDSRFAATVKVLKETVEHHVEEEEEELFPAARKVIGQELLEAMTQEMLAEMAQLEGTEPRFEVPKETDTAAQV